MRESNLSVPDADALIRLADALDTTVQTLLGQPEEEPDTPSDIAASLNRINDQLAIQNRRRNRIWKVVAWVAGLYVAFNLLLLVLGYAMTAELDAEVTTTSEHLVITEEIE